MTCKEQGNGVAYPWSVPVRASDVGLPPAVGDGAAEALEAQRRSGLTRGIAGELPERSDTSLVH